MAARLSSMTGFGAARGDAAWGAWSIEAKSVNGRGLDVRVTTPPGFDALEGQAKAEASRHFARGNTQIAIRIDVSAEAASVQINRDLLSDLIAELGHQASGDPRPVTPDMLATLLTVRGVVEPATVDLRALAEDPAVHDVLVSGVSKALVALAAARREEGAALAAMFVRLLGDFRQTLREAEVAAAAQPSHLKARLETQLAELGAREGIDAERLAAEVALSVAKGDVREEVDRLQAHFDQAETLLSGGSPVGRQLDFLSQEIGREANTLCSKSASLELTQAGLALKALNDQFKEQAANVE